MVERLGALNRERVRLRHAHVGDDMRHLVRARRLELHLRQRLVRDHPHPGGIARADRGNPEHIHRIIARRFGLTFRLLVSPARFSQPWASNSRLPSEACEINGLGA